MGLCSRVVLVLSLAWSLTACAGSPVGDVARQTIPVFLRAPSPVLSALPASDFFGSSTLRLSKNGDGSISVLSDGRSVFLLRGLDPALVNPAVRPFLFPSCDVPASR
ncbi:MAG: hypothetical protein WCH20_08345 [Nitrospira sp.]